MDSTRERVGEDVVLASEAARIARCSDDTLRRAFDRGEISGLKTPAGVRVFFRASVQAFADARAERRNPR